ncbi:SUMF1/EgtB/PvdO family nonheme iron enzyme [candidate division KSB1 bacterium]|nr:SUMF1/EgtB/PvdO family nonheme iron enzyme [candidate division KSB1 bacterium]
MYRSFLRYPVFVFLILLLIMALDHAFVIHAQTPADTSIADSIISPNPDTAQTDIWQWLKNHFTFENLIYALFGAAIPLLTWLLTYLFKGRVKKIEVLTEHNVKRDIDQEIKQSTHNETLRNYLLYVRRTHGLIRLYGFQSQANIDVRLLDVFVSLRFAEMNAEHDVTRPGKAESENERELMPKEVLARAMKRKRALLVLGGPGSGKTTLLKYFAVCCLTEADRNEYLGCKKQIIPLFIPLRQIEPGQQFTKTISEWALKHTHLVIKPEQIETWLRRTGALVMLDGLDEISSMEKRRRMCEWIDEAASTYGETGTFVITCRHSGYRQADGVNLTIPLVRADVRDLSHNQQHQFLRQWFEAAALDAMEKIEHVDDQRKQEIGHDAESEAVAVIEFLSKDENAALGDMAGTPVLLQIMAIIWREQGSLSGERVELYSRCVDYLLDHRDRIRKIEPLMSASKARLVLRPLALTMQTDWHSDEADREKIIEQIKDKLQEVKPDKTALEFLENIRDRAGVLVGSGSESYMFQHKSFREFLAAVEIANRGDAELLTNNFGDDWWRETCLFAAGMTSPEIFPAMIERLLKSDKNDATHFLLLKQLVTEAAVKPLEPFAVVIRDKRLGMQKRYNALQCLREMKSPAARKVLENATQDKEKRVGETAEQILAEWSVSDVIEAGVPESLASDDFVLHGVQAKPVQPAVKKIVTLDKRFRNPFEVNAEYIRISGGSYTYSVTNEIVTIPMLWFARYPVTNRQYRRFITFLSGKKEQTLAILENIQFEKTFMQQANTIKGFKEYLGDATGVTAWTDKFRSRSDDDKRFNGDDQPVVSVTWFAAVAYCCWLTELYRTTNPDGPKLEFRLPTETEWQWAAGGGQRNYPWGNEPPDDSRANYGSKVGQTTPVGAYPAGATPDGLMDMAGNVWEWMENWPGKEEKYRALRGGSWDDGSTGLRCGARFSYDPVDGVSLSGFRVLAVPAES